MLDFEIRPSRDPLPDRERETALLAPGFGEVFTDHMVTIRWSEGIGWHDARIEPYGPFTLDPASKVFHYGQEIFEGMKAYRQSGGAVAMFRPAENAARFNRSAQRLAMPEIPEEDFVRALELLVTQDRAWVPETPGDSLYLRPMMIATQRGLGFTHPSTEYLFSVIASPAAAYFGTHLRAVSVWLGEHHTRAAPGGTGAAKVGGNYAAALVAGREATANGCDQVVWLDAAEHAWVEEMGGMNMFFVYSEPGAPPRIVTPELTGTLLPGVTRDSLLTLAPDLGIAATEERVSVERWQRDCAAGTLTETFACGTAAVIAPVGTVRGAGRAWRIGDGGPGPVTVRLREELVGVQYGLRPDPFGWVHKVC